MHFRLKAAWAAFALAIVTMLSACSDPLERSAPYDPEQMAREVTQDVGAVDRSSPGTYGAPVLLLEERHDSRKGQIEQAVSLVRFHGRHALRDIVLEGYLKDGPKLDPGFFHKQGADALARAQVAVPLLQEGEISSAEFMALVFTDIKLHPSEVSLEYNLELGVEPSVAPIQYLFRIALQPEDEGTLDDLWRKRPQVEDEAWQAKMRQFLERVISSDPWAQSAYAKYTGNGDGGNTITTGEMCALVKEIQTRAHSIPLSEQETEAMKDCIAFWCGRSLADKTMFLSTSEVANQTGDSPVALIIGAAHTAEIATLLEQANRPYAAVTPLSLKDGSGGDLNNEMSERKQKKLSVHPYEFLRFIFDNGPTGSKKPPPVINEPWFEADANLRFLTAGITRRLLGGGGAPPREPPVGTGLPADFSDDDLNRRFVSINRESISVVYDDEENRTGRGVILQAAIFSQPVWVKLTHSNDEIESTIESMLVKARDEVGNFDREASSRNQAVFPMTLGVTAVVANSEEAARSTRLKS